MWGSRSSLSDALGSKPPLHTRIARTGLGLVQFSASPLSRIPKFRRGTETKLVFFPYIQGSEGPILDLSPPLLLIYFVPHRSLLRRGSRWVSLKKIAVMKKQEVRGGRWEEGNNRTLCFLFPLTIVPCAFLFCFSRPPYDEKRPLRRREPAPSSSSWPLF